MENQIKTINGKTIKVDGITDYLCDGGAVSIAYVSDKRCKDNMRRYMIAGNTGINNIWYRVGTPCYTIRDREAGNVIDIHTDIDKAIRCLTDYESQDKRDNTYCPDFYEIFDNNNEQVIEI